MEEQRRTQTTDDRPGAGERNARAEDTPLVEQDEPLKSHGDEREQQIPRDGQRTERDGGGA